MSSLESAMREDPTTVALLSHKRDAQAAEAAIQFFCNGKPSSDENWYRSSTWRRIMEVFVKLAPTVGTAWFVATNNDPGSLPTGNQLLLVGQVVEIDGEGKKRFVTSTMGSSGRCYAYFKNQASVPLNEVRWRTVADSRSFMPAANNVTASEPTIAPSNKPIGDSQTPKQVAIPLGQPRSLATRIREHQWVSLLVLAVVAVIGLGSLTDAVSKIKVSLDKVSEFLHRRPPRPPVGGQEFAGLSAPQTEPANHATRTEEKSTVPAIEAVPKESPSHGPEISITSPLNDGAAEFQSKEGMTLVAVNGQSLGLTTSNSILLTVTASDFIERPQWHGNGVDLVSDGRWSGDVLVGGPNEQPMPGNEYKLKAYVLPKDRYDECKRKALSGALIWSEIKSEFRSSEPITFRLAEPKP